MRCCLAFLLFLFAPLLSQAQDIPAVGEAATFDTATWNIEWFGGSSGPSNNEKQFLNVLAVLRSADIDLWALQEVTSTATFNRLLDSLGTGWAGTLAEEPGSDRQRTAYVWNTNVVTLTSSPRQVLSSSSYAFAGRPPLRLDLRVDIDGRSETYTFFTIHAKCCGGGDDRQRRADGANALKGYIDALLPTANVVVLGDFNDELRNSIAGGTTPYQNFLDDPDDWHFLTADFDLAGTSADTRTYCRNSSCSSGSVLDHILVSNEALALYHTDTIARFDALLDAFDDAGGEFVSTTSDHLPVYARFGFAPGVPNADDGVLPTALTLSGAAPNPFTSATHFTYTLPHSADVQVDVYDALGRHVRTLLHTTRPAGTHTVRFAADALPPGLYLIRLTTEGTSIVRRVVLTP